MNTPPLRAIVVAAVLVLAGFGAMRALSGEKDETAMGIENAITVPIDRAAHVQAESNVRAAQAAAQLYFAENGSYAGISTSALRTIDAGLSPSVQVVATAGGYCAMAVVRGVSVRNIGPSADIADGSC